MQKRRLWRYGKRGVGVAMVMSLVLAVVASTVDDVALAETSSSNNYQITESQFSAGAGFQSCSDQYCSQVSIGDATGANIAGSASFGIAPIGEPVLEVIVEPGVSNLGVLKPEATATKTTIVRVRNHLVGGYVLQIYGDPPKFGDHTLYAPSDPTPSIPGTEQFAMNLVANSTPLVGADPQQVPDEETVFGYAELGYDTPNHFKYVSGDTIAKSITESGRTDYTISMIVNISSGTPPGRYAGDFTAIVVPLY